VAARSSLEKDAIRYFSSEDMFIYNLKMMDWSFKLRQNLLKLRCCFFAKNIDGIEEAVAAFYAADITGSCQLTKVGFETFLKSVGLFVP